jgi:hypothetical protein
MKALLSLVLILCLCTSGARGLDDKDDRDSLKGIKAVYVIVESLDPQIEKLGLTSSQIQTDIEIKLRKSGITIERRPTLGHLHLSVNILLPKDGTGTVAYSIRVEFEQQVQLSRDPKIVHPGAVTWSSGEIGQVGSNKIRQVREAVNDQVDQFVNAFLSVNPR